MIIVDTKYWWLQNQALASSSKQTPTKEQIFEKYRI